MTTSDHSHSLCDSIVKIHWNDYPSIKQWNDVRPRRWGQWLPAPSECLADLCWKAPKLGKQQKSRLWLNCWVFISTNAGFPMNMDLGSPFRSDLGNSTSTTAPQVRPDCWGATPGGSGDRQFIGITSNKLDMAIETPAFGATNETGNTDAGRVLVNMCSAKHPTKTTLLWPRQVGMHWNLDKARPVDFTGFKRWSFNMFKAPTMNINR